MNKLIIAIAITTMVLLFSYSKEPKEMDDSFEILNYNITAVGPAAKMSQKEYKFLLTNLKDQEVAKSKRFQKKLGILKGNVTLSSEDIMILYFAHALDAAELKKELNGKCVQFEYSHKSFAITQPPDDIYLKFCRES